MLLVHSARRRGYATQKGVASRPRVTCKGRATHERGGDVVSHARESQQGKGGDTLKEAAGSHRTNGKVEAPRATHEGGGDFVSRP